jgi:hypothetical protein
VHDVLGFYLTHLYENSAYQNLWFTVGSKPLIMIAGDSSVCNDNRLVNYECRNIGGLDNGSGSRWQFKDRTPQGFFSSFAWPEQISATPAYQGCWMSQQDVAVPAWAYPPNGCAPSVGRRNFQTFSEQWSVTQGTNPTYVMVFSWNEWIAQNLACVPLGSPSCTPYDPHNPPPGLPAQLFTDHFNQEYSSDIEPMAGGHGNQYYNYMVSLIAAYKRNVPNFALLDQNTGHWLLKFYIGDQALASTNYAADLPWAAGQQFVGDFDEDGQVDIGLRDSNTGTWYFTTKMNSTWYANNNTFTWLAGSQYQPIVGDFDGDGHLDIGLWDSTTGVWHFATRVSPFQFAETSWVTWGCGSCQPFVGDFDGDGHIDIGLWDPSNGVWHFALYQNRWWYANTNDFTWALSGPDYQTVTGDFDGDGRFDIGLRRLSDGTIFTLNGGASHFTFVNNDNFKGPAGAQYTIRVMSRLVGVTAPN